MASFKKTRNIIIKSYFDDVIDDEEFVLRYDATYSKNQEFPYKDYENFCPDEIDKNRYA